MALVVAVMIWMAVGSKGRDGATSADDDDTAGAEDSTRQKSRRKKPLPEVAAEPPIVKTVSCRVVTHEPGFFVLVDGEPARSDSGEKLTTPCEIEIPPGNHTLTAVREKFRDYSEDVIISGGQAFEFTPVYEPFAEPAGYFASRLASAKVGRPVELTSVNARGPGWDPFLSADGLSLWFAGQKSDGRGIYVARRAQVYSEFGDSELVSKSSDRPACPSLTDNLLTLAYAVPGRAQIRSLARSDVEARFKQGPILRFDEHDEANWPAAQIGADGKTLYYIEERNGKTTANVTKRRALGRPFDGDAKSFQLPGGYPRLTRDGLRQFWFDGEKLFRSSRANVESAFSTPEPLSDFGFDGYTPRPLYRQYFVSDDEQWLYYSDDPQETGKIYAVRIAPGPRWGYAPHGQPLRQQDLARKSAGGGSTGREARGRESSKVFEWPKEEPKTTGTNTTATKAAGSNPTGPMASDEKAPKEEAPGIDPRTAPLPYAEFRARLDGLIAARDYPAAQAAILAAQEDQRLAPDKTQLEWDRDDVARLVRFQQRVDDALANLKPAEIVKAGSLQIEFGKYEEGQITGKVRGSDKIVSRALADLTPVELTALVDKRVNRSDVAAQLEIATFLDRSLNVSPQALQTRFDRAGATGKEVQERKNLRQLHLIEQELARENLGVALAQIERLTAAAPKSKTVGQARQLRDNLYLRIQWKPVGKQSWDTSVPGEYAATGSKSPGAYLISPAEYGNFLLTLEWKTTNDLAQGGVNYHYKNAGDLRKNAFKINLAADYATRDAPDKFATGSLFGIKGPTSNPVKLNGQWNTLQVRVQENRVQASVNGVDVLDTPASLKTIASEGFICLDGEFPGITYRKVLVYEIFPKK